MSRQLKIFDDDAGTKSIILNNIKFNKTAGGLIFLYVHGDKKMDLDELTKIPPASVTVTFRG